MLTPQRERQAKYNELLEEASNEGRIAVADLKSVHYDLEQSPITSSCKLIMFSKFGTFTTHGLVWNHLKDVPFTACNVARLHAWPIGPMLRQVGSIFDVHAQLVAKTTTHTNLKEMVGNGWNLRTV